MIYGYARVSTDGQSVAAQVAALRKHGAGKVFREVASGAKTDRAQLRRLLDQPDAGDVLMVTGLDRLARSTRDLLNTLATITGAPVRKLRFVEALGQTRVPFAGHRPDHRTGVELATIDAHRAAEAAADLDVDSMMMLRARRGGTGSKYVTLRGGVRRAIPFLLVRSRLRCEGSSILCGQGGSRPPFRRLHRTGRST
jgi:hypothetical protein